MSDMRWQENTCPICERTFKVTPSDDYLIPACGCYDDAEPGHYPCEACGMSHVYACKFKQPVPERRFTVIVDDEDNILAQTEGVNEGAALASEFIVEPSP